jgi:glycosyltransferase involved in cell wall biosynthesis
MTDSSSLFVTRKFPPSIGGMENVAYELHKRLSLLTDIKLVKWGGSNRWLPVVLPYLFLHSSWVLLTRKISTIYLEDGLLAPLGLALKSLFRKPAVITIHGRDIGFKNRFYQSVIPGCLNNLDKVVCVSDALMKTCASRGIDAKRLTVIENGVSDEYNAYLDKPELVKQVSQIVGADLSGKTILLSVGRLVEKKGIHWFVDKVMPSLAEMNCVYLIAGDGPMLQAINKSIEEHKLKEHIYALGWADKDKLRILYNAADIFIMPNIPVEVAGFGLVALEAASCGLTVVTSDWGGISDAIKNGKNGFLVKPGDAEEYIAKLRELLGARDVLEAFRVQAREYTLQNYDWGRIAEKYLRTFDSIRAYNMRR